MWSNLALVLQCLVAWLGASVGASYLPLASWDLYLDTLHTVLFKHLEGAWAWSPASALLDGAPPSGVECPLCRVRSTTVKRVY